MKTPTGERYSRSAFLSRQRQIERDRALTPSQGAERQRRLEERVREFKARLLPKPE